ncbi:MAG: TIGR00341 family protein [Gammaproteobacteria bacterium]|nr:TIGR00341 family protein [Gammaproteobacteria bacterium]
MRLIEIIADAGHTDTLAGIADQHEITDYWWGAAADDGRRAFRMLVNDCKRQLVMDSLQSLFGGSDNVRIVVLPVDTTLPREAQDQSGAAKATREELYTQIEKGARIDGNFLLLTFLSTVVAAIGLIEDNVAVVVGAMVIAPLLGPNIALAFGSSLGDGTLVWKALRAALTGLGLAFGLSLVIGLLWPVDIARGQMLIASSEILARTDVGLDGVVLALASGAAAVLSLTTGLSSTLVGVMVAVALLPPTATMGMLFGAGQPQLAIGAGLLLAVNVVCVIVAARLVFMAKGVRPRTWYERRKARQSTLIYGLTWLALLAVLLVIVYARHRVFH